MSAQKVFVGIDFGAAYSGISYILMKNGKESCEYTISHAPESQPDAETPKAPTILGMQEPLTPESEKSWGYGIDPGHRAFQWIKLALPHPDKLPSVMKKSGHLDEFLTQSNHRLQHDLDAEYLASAYLSELWAKFVEELQVEHEIDICCCDVYVAAGKPVLWKDIEAPLMSVFKKTKIPELQSVTFLPEPEATAIALLPGLAAAIDLQDKDVLLICDCGGGTVDIMAYRWAAEKGQLDEFLFADSILAGSFLLEDNFLKILREEAAKHVAKSKLDELTAADWAFIVEQQWRRKIMPHLHKTDIESWSVSIEKSDGDVSGPQVTNKVSLTK